MTRFQGNLFLNLVQWGPPTSIQEMLDGFIYLVEAEEVLAG